MRSSNLSPPQKTYSLSSRCRSALSIFLVLTFLGCISGCSAIAEITSFDECVAAGNLVMKSFPAQCITQDGKRFVDKRSKGVSPTIICIDKCGDGVCQEIVCMGEGCPCAESIENCVKDCSKNNNS